MPTRAHQDKETAMLIDEVRHGASTSRAQDLAYRVLRTLSDRYTNAGTYGMEVLEVLRDVQAPTMEPVHASVREPVVRILMLALENTLNGVAIDIENREATERARANGWI